MAFGNYYNPYNQYTPGYYQPMQTPNLPQTNSNITWVPNMEAAMNDPLGPNQAKAYWDTYQPKVYVRKTDASGRPEMTAYTITADSAQASVAPTSPAPAYVGMDAFEGLKARVAALEGRDGKKKEKEKAE